MQSTVSYDEIKLRFCKVMLRLYEGVRVSVYGGRKRKHLEEKNQDPRTKNQDPNKKNRIKKKEFKSKRAKSTKKKKWELNRYCSDFPFYNRNILLSPYSVFFLPLSLSCLDLVSWIFFLFHKCHFLRQHFPSNARAHYINSPWPGLYFRNSDERRTFEYRCAN